MAKGVGLMPSMPAHPLRVVLYDDLSRRTSAASAQTAFEPHPFRKWRKGWDSNPRLV